MVKIKLTLSNLRNRTVHTLLAKTRLTKLLFFSLFYNDFFNKYYALDTFLEPMFFFVDSFTKIMGPIFVILVQIMTYSIVAIAYVLGLPYWIHHSRLATAIAVPLGHWLLLNINFHYYMAYVTSPGVPPEGALILEAVSICKKCISPKPHRTHHCSVCDKCILKMDHHCPWLNTCIGHYNHRYFFMYCVYMCLGTAFILLFGAKIAYDHVFLSPIQVVTSVVKNHSDTENIPKRQTDYFTFIDPHGMLYHSCLVYAAFICIGVLVVLGVLTLWHAILITSGETSIEAHINKKERTAHQKRGQFYVNPYDYGKIRNWKQFLGLTKSRGWRYLLLPSTHTPEDDGLNWHSKRIDHELCI